MSLMQPKGSVERPQDHRQTNALDGKLEEPDLDGPRAIRPLHDRIYIQRVRVKESAGGILFPATFRQAKQFSARERMNAIPDVFHAYVLAVGPDVRELARGDEIVVFAYAEGDGSKLYTGDSSGEKDRMFIGPDDVVCAVDRS